MSEIIQQAENYVQQLLQSTLPSHFVYHNLAHTTYVTKAAGILAQDAHLSPEETEMLTLAALFHDTGYTKSAVDHEKHSVDIASAYLHSIQYPEASIQEVLNAIEATKMPQVPAGKLGALLQDADLSNLAEPDWFKHASRLRQEWAAVENKVFTDEEWDKRNMDVLKQTKFHTLQGKARYMEQTEHNRKTLKDQIKLKEKSEPESLINGNRTAEMLFKTALRNHINLTQIADNKANIMLSINALILTVALPALLRSGATADVFMIIPAATIGVTCVISIIYAAMSTQPGKFKGQFDINDIKAGKGSLFFFGNFYNSSLEDYSHAMKISLRQEQHLDDAAIMDLYFMGKSLGRKFSLLRMCYSFFLIGITLSSALFVLGFLIKR